MNEATDTQKPPLDNPSRTVARHPWNSTHILRQWYAANSAWPYPTAEEKDELSRRTGLSIRQVSQWFVNARRRNNEQQTHGRSTSRGNSAVLSLPVISDPSRKQCNNVTLPDRRRQSFKEGESVTSHTPVQEVDEVTSSGHVSQNTVNTITQSGTSNLQSTAFSATSSYASSSFHSPNFANHRKQSLGSRYAEIDRLAENRDSRIYQCTFCTDTFKSRYDWTRHEGTLHLPLEQWTCLPYGPRRWDFGNISSKCSLCDECDPTDTHLDSHRISDCTVKPRSLRTFQRKDHLLQHLRLTHGVKKVIPSMNAWRSRISRVQSRCGFCGETFSVWSDRNDHLVEHFRSGKSMKDWKGDRGFEPSIAMLVQSAIPPYLISTESLELEPFSASKGAMKKILSSPQIQNPPNIFEVLTARLGDFVTAARAKGTTINCDILRREARLILYGDDDPSNRTPADNGQWLALFKIGHGLASEPSQQHSAPLMTEEDTPTLSSNTDIAGPLPSETVHTAPLYRLTGQKPRPISTAKHIHDKVKSALPWWCQTPECLAELMRMSQEFSLTILGNIEIDD